MAVATISATIEGSDALLDKIKNFRSDIQSILDEGTIAAGEILQKEMQYRAPRDTGGLANDITVEREDTEGDLSSAVSVGPRTFPGARMREYGGIIKAINAPYLVFQTKDGAWHKCKSVTQPATPYIRPAVAAKRNEAVAKMKSLIRKGWGL